MTIGGRAVLMRRAAKAGALALSSALAGATAVELLRAIDVHPAGVLLLSLAFASGSVAAGAAIVFMVWVERRMRDMQHDLCENARQLSALVAVRPLAGELPLALGGWAIDPLFADLLVQAMVQQRPHVVVECGSGSSTVLSLNACRFASKMSAGIPRQKTPAVSRSSQISARPRVKTYARPRFSLARSFARPPGGVHSLMSPELVSYLKPRPVSRPVTIHERKSRIAYVLSSSAESAMFSDAAPL